MLSGEASGLAGSRVFLSKISSARRHAAARATEAADRLQTMLRYGWEANDDQMRACVEQCVRVAGGDRLNAGARPGLVEDVTRRSVTRRGHWWVRRPAIEEVVTVTAVEPEAEVFPAVDVYDRLTCPMTIVLAEMVFTPRGATKRVPSSMPPPGCRRLIDISSNHSVPMPRPADLDAIIRCLVRDRAAASVGNVE